MFATLAGIAVTLIAAFVLRGRFGHAGIAMAISLGAWTMAAWLGIQLARIATLADADTLRRLSRIGLASLIMAATLIAGLRQFGAQPEFALAALQLAVLVTGGLAIYAALLRSLGVVSFDDLRAAFRAKS